MNRMDLEEMKPGTIKNNHLINRTQNLFQEWISQWILQRDHVNSLKMENARMVKIADTDTLNSYNMNINWRTTKKKIWWNLKWSNFISMDIYSWVEQMSKIWCQNKESLN